MPTGSTNRKIKSEKTHIKSGDLVYVISGKEKGKTGKIIKFLKDKNMALVEKLNIVKKHSKATQKNPTGGIIEKEAGIHVSNLMLYDATIGEPTRIRNSRLKSGEKVRISVKSGEEIK